MIVCPKPRVFYVFPLFRIVLRGHLAGRRLGDHRPCNPRATCCFFFFFIFLGSRSGQLPTAVNFATLSQDGGLLLTTPAGRRRRARLADLRDCPRLWGIHLPILATVGARARAPWKGNG